MSHKLLDINTNPLSKTEIIKAIKFLKSGKVAGPDGIPPEALKADIQTSTEMLHPFICMLWEQERVSDNWKKGHIVKLPKKGHLHLAKQVRNHAVAYFWQTPLYAVLVDFQKAFDSVDRDVIWRLMHHYGFSPKFVNIIQQMYEDATCRVIHDGKLTEPFSVQTGVRQAVCSHRPFFLMVFD